MFEIILLIYLCNTIAKLAGKKNVSKRRWVITTVFYWIAGEIIGYLLLLATLGIDLEKEDGAKVLADNILYIMFAGLLGGYLGYLFTRKRLEDLPDSDEIIE